MPDSVVCPGCFRWLSVLHCLHCEWFVCPRCESLVTAEGRSFLLDDLTMVTWAEGV